MSFRQRNKTLENEWLAKSRSLLLATGLPVDVLEDVRRWHYVLNHGYDPGKQLESFLDGEGTC